MKKIFSFFAAALLSVAFIACEDVPAPYEINNGTGNGGNTPSSEDLLINETFASSLGKFSAICTEGNYPWYVDYSCAQVTSFVDTDGDGTKENVPAVSWLVSPTVDLTDVEAAYVSFSYILRYITNSQLATHYQLLVSKDYSGDGNVAAATWEPLDIELVQGADWSTWYNCSVNLPEAYCKTSGVTVALRYTTTSKAATWKVKNFLLVKGTYTPDAPDEGGVKDLPYSEDFSTTLGSFSNYTTDGSGEWVIDFKTAKATGYDNATTVTTAGTYYLVSPEISLAGQTEAYISYEYILRYNKADENQQLLISTSFDEEHPAEGWTLLKQDHKEGTDWTTFASAAVQIPAEYMGKNVRIALRYNTNATSGSTWEVRNFSAQSGQIGGTTPSTPTGENLLLNGDFESWTSGKPDNWATASTAGSATLSQSTDAHDGSYSVNVGGSSTGNKRLAYKETILKAGTYTMKFYAKAATADAASVRPGYATFNADGSINSSGYKYGSYVNDISNTGWTEVTHEFTLASEQQVCLVVMNPKSTTGAAVLIDDFSLTTADGGIVGGGGSTPDPTPDPTPGGTYALATSVQSGASYLIAALEGGAYKLATAAQASYTYGYLNVTDATASNGLITTATANEEFIFKAVSGGYTIQDAVGRYLYMTSTFNSFNYSTDPSVEGAVWSVTFNADGTANIKNVLKEKTLQYSSQFTSYGAYSSVTNTLPSLFVKQ